MLQDFGICGFGSRVHQGLVLFVKSWPALLLRVRFAPTCFCMNLGYPDQLSTQPLNHQRVCGLYIVFVGVEGFWFRVSGF